MQIILEDFRSKKMKFKLTNEWVIYNSHMYNSHVKVRNDNLIMTFKYFST